VKIFINGRFLSQSITGVQRYAREVVKSIDSLLNDPKWSKNYDVILVAPNNVSSDLDLKNIEIKKVGKLTGHLWEQLELPWFTKNKFLLNLCNVGPAFKRNQFVTIHDASVYLKENNFSRVFKVWYKFLYAMEVRFSKMIITVSNFSKVELIKYTHVDPQKILVTYEGNEHLKQLNSDNRILKKNGLIQKTYILAVSSMDPRKNFRNIIRAVQECKSNSFEVVIAGGTNPKIFNTKNEIGFLHNVKYLGYVTDKELKSLYEHTACFVYPSYYEGFGIPPLEAMASGCPVIVSNRASLPEICKQAALYCDPDDPKSIADKINMLIKDEKLRNQYRDLGKKRAESFTWMKCSINILNAVEHVRN
jgi:glycosyltransferase involved in cell wall biosynthesis